MELERRHNQEVHNTNYLVPNYHIVSIAPKSKRNLFKYRLLRPLHDLDVYFLKRLIIM